MKRFVLETVLILGIAPAIAGAQGQSAASTPLGVRQHRGQFLPRPFEVAMVTATDEGLVELSFDESLRRRAGLPREIVATREYFEPAEVLRWIDQAGTVAMWKESDIPGDAPVARLGREGSVVFEAAGRLAERGGRQVYFRTHRCGQPPQETWVDPVVLATVLESFRRAAVEAGSVTRRTVPDDAVWYEHAVGCPATLADGNRAPAWPAGAELRPREVLVTFVVDTMGRVMPSTERFLPSADPAFVASVREALPAWRFRTARRRGVPVKQLMHLNVAFLPPLVLDATGRACPDASTAGITARLTRPARDGVSLDAFLANVVASLAGSLVAPSLHRQTLRFDYSLDRRPLQVELDPGDFGVPLSPSDRRALDIALPTLVPDLPAAIGRDTVGIEVHFGVRCDILLTAPLAHEVVSIRPQGDGTLRIVNAMDVEGHVRPGEMTALRMVISAASLGGVVDLALTRWDSVRTSGAAVDGPLTTRDPHEQVIGAEAPGSKVWVTPSGWIRAGTSCGYTSSRFFEISPDDLPGFRRVAAAAIELAARQPRWTASPNRAFGTSELTCDVIRQSPDVRPVLRGVSSSQASVEAIVQFTVDTTGRVETGSVEVMPGVDAVVAQLVAATVQEMRFQPAVAGLSTVRARTHATVVVRPETADAVVVALTPPPAPAADTLRRTLFFRPNAQPDRPLAVTSDSAMADLFRAMQPFVDMARSTWPQARERFERGLPGGYELFVTVRLRDTYGRTEQLFVRVDRLAGESIHGHIESHVTTIARWRRGDPIQLSTRDLLDWTIVAPDGTEEGNYLGRFLDAIRRRR